MHAKAHITRLRLDAEELEHPNEVRISAIVKHHESGIDRPGLSERFEIDRMSVTTEAVGRFQ